ncbi:MAG: BACON domain-containing carbohydrate-binding protein, partial [Desulfosalsimonadaceae bacterium]
LYDYGKVQIKAVGDTTWTSISGDYYDTSNGEWTRPSIDLAAYAGKSVQIAFYFHSDGGASNVSSGWYIDDVIIEPITQQTGSLIVTLTPQEAINAGAQWRVDSGAWQNSGATVSKLTIGSHTVNYKPITGWTAPADQAVTIVNDPAATKIGIYTQQPVLSVSPFIRRVAKEAGTTTFIVSNTGTGIMPWNASVISGIGWLSISSRASGSTSGTITCAFTANAGIAERTGTIRVTATGATGSPIDVTVTQAETPPASDFFTRSVQTFFIPGVKMTVTISANPSSGISNYAVEDMPPAGWTVSNWSTGGVYDTAHHKVKFGAFFDSNSRTFTYDITPPAGASGVQTFNGTGSIDGTNYPIVGVSQVNMGTHHPADLNAADFNLVIAEYTAYGAAWKTGTAWPVVPNPIPISYVTKAGQLWKSGESYVYNPLAGDPPLCWVNVSINAVRSLRYALSSFSTAVCGMPQISMPGETFTVSITVTPVSEVASYAVEDLFPTGWTVSNISDSGDIDAVANKVKFGPFLDQNERTLTYDITPPVTASGPYTFAGIASFDGNNVAVGGVRQITAQPAPKLADVIKGLQVLAGVDVDIENSLADANGNGKVEMNDVLENLRKIAGLK